MRVSLLMAACNQGNYLRETIASAHEGFAGTDDWQIVVVDDASTDGCCDGIDDDRVTVVRPRTRIGVSAAKHLAGEVATGDVLITSDCHCYYPEGGLTALAIIANSMRAVILPSVALEGKHRCYGGSLTICDRGIRVDMPRHTRAWPALYGSIYAFQRQIWDALAGWPVLPGFWGCEEQLVSSLAYRFGIPIHVADDLVCTHRQYRRRNVYPYTLPPEDWPRAAHWFHAAAYPETYRYIWRHVLDRFYGANPALTADLQTNRFREFCGWLENRSVRTEFWVIETVMNVPDLREHRVIKELLG